MNATGFGVGCVAAITGSGGANGGGMMGGCAAAGLPDGTSTGAQEDWGVGAATAGAGGGMMGGGGAAATGGCGASCTTGFPHLVQNLTASGIAAPHERQTRPVTAAGGAGGATARGLPQDVQNFRPGSFWFPQFAQAAMAFILRCKL